MHDDLTNKKIVVGFYYVASIFLLILVIIKFNYFLLFAFIMHSAVTYIYTRELVNDLTVSSRTE